MVARGFQTPADGGARRALLEAVSQQAEVIALRETAGQGVKLI
ncbi:hypothetical protein [Leisingera methylohalidivorans]|uniref:Uncharacterized protein n=1 Tax=Leisingera methylohalidivorans DSM 14336 TaxID=999552 RepID=V9W1T1_9RHOB|nr:hypothetical protein [Leisingera methylohalidivorans]AHD03127.1 hypothetical protein METH_13185 [Leisingera methylohalidivorans DSM 14336]